MMPLDGKSGRTTVRRTVFHVRNDSLIPLFCGGSNMYQGVNAACNNKASVSAIILNAGLLAAPRKQMFLLHLSVFFSLLISPKPRESQAIF